MIHVDTLISTFDAPYKFWAIFELNSGVTDESMVYSIACSRHFAWVVIVLMTK